MIMNTKDYYWDTDRNKSLDRFINLLVILIKTKVMKIGFCGTMSVGKTTLVI